LSEILSNVSEVSQMVSNIASSSQEQAAGIKTITSTVRVMEAAAVENSEVSRSVSDIASGLSQNAVALQDSVEHLLQIVYAQSNLSAGDGATVQNKKVA
jgi:methyl-accepting chemotaxis protein